MTAPRVFDRSVRVGLFLLVWLSCAWFGSWAYNANNATRLFAAVSIVEQGDATIDEYAHMTIDEAHFGDHVYSDKAPGMTLMAVPIVAAADALTGTTATDMAKDHYNFALDRFLMLRLRLAAALTAGLLTAFASVLVYTLGRDLTGNAGAGLFAGLGFGMGTTMWGWSTTIFGHAPVAALFVVAIWAIARGTEGAHAGRHATLAGAALGWAVVIEQQAVIAGSAIALWALWRLRRRPDGARIAALAVIAGAVALVPLAAYNVFAFGTPFRLGYQGVQGFAGMQEGLFGLTYPRGSALWGITLGVRRGIVWVAPVILLAPYGWWRLWRTDARDLALLGAGGTLLALLVNAAYVYWDGGASMGPRHAVPAFAFLALGLAPAWAGLRAGWARGVAAALLALSMLVNLGIAASDVTPSELYANPLWQSVWLAHWRYGWLTDLPADWLRWSPLHGLIPYVVTAIPLLGWLLVSLPERVGAAQPLELVPQEEAAAEHQYG